VGTAGGGGSTGAAGQGGSTPGCTGTPPPAGTPPSLTCCTEYDHTLLATACDTNDTYIYNLAFSPDGKMLVTGGDDGRYVFWNFDGQTLTPEGHHITGGVYGYLGISPDSATLVAGGNDVHLFGIASLSDGGGMTIDYTSYGVAWAPDGQRVIDIDDTSLYVHSVATLSQIAKAALIHTPWAMAVSPVAVGGGIGVVMPSTSGYATIYSVTGTASASTIGTPLDVNVSANELWSAAFSPNGTQLAIGGYDSYVNIWNYPLATASDPPAISFSIDEPMHLEDVQGMAFSPNGRYIAVASGYNQGHASVWDLTTKTLVGRFLLTSRYALSVAFSPSGNAIAVGEHGCGKFLLCTQ
jgi:WD40 repeat protein